MKKIILICLCFLAFCTLSAKEQIIVIKTTGGAERQVLDKNDKPTGETFIGYNNVALKLDDDLKITLDCSGDGWEPFELDLNPNKVKCEYKDLLKLAQDKIKKGENNGKFKDEITKGKKKFKRSVKWSSTGIYKSSKIVITLNDK
jgi:hypothetical protein